MSARSPWPALFVIALSAMIGTALWFASSANRVPSSAIAIARAESGARPADTQVLFGGAFDTDCTHVGADAESGGYQFIVECPGKAVSPDGRWAVARTAKGIVKLDDREGQVLDGISALEDDMPFVLFWSPKSDRFFVNHYLGSSLDRLRVFRIVNRAVFEQSSVFTEATRVAVARYPCLGTHANVVASGWRWARDGRRIAMVVYARPDACQEADGGGSWRQTGIWRVLWMIGDVETGRIDPDSIRIRRGGVGPMPKDGPYASL